WGWRNRREPHRQAAQSVSRSPGIGTCSKLLKWRISFSEKPVSIFPGYALTADGDRVNATAQFQDRLNQVAKDTEVLLDQLLAKGLAGGELARPPRLRDAMRYASLGAGKRFRPFLVAESASLFRVPRQQALMAGAALECVHCYSLVHDDLPAMDNDELRRGQPTVHKA